MGLHRLTVDRLSLITGISASAISKWLSGDREPSFGSALTLSVVFGISAERLYTSDFNDLLINELSRRDRFDSVERLINSEYATENIDALTKYLN